MYFLKILLEEYYNNNKGRMRITDPIPFNVLLELVTKAGILEEIDKEIDKSNI